MRDEFRERGWGTRANGTLRKGPLHVFKRSKIKAGSIVDKDLPELMKETGRDDYIVVHADLNKAKDRCTVLGRAKDLRNMKAVLKLLGVF